MHVYHGWFICLWWFIMAYHHFPYTVGITWRYIALFWSIPPLLDKRKQGNLPFLAIWNHRNWWLDPHSKKLSKTHFSTSNTSRFLTVLMLQSSSIPQGLLLKIPIFPLADPPLKFYPRSSSKQPTPTPRAARDAMLRVARGFADAMLVEPLPLGKKIS